MDDQSFRLGDHGRCLAKSDAKNVMRKQTSIRTLLVLTAVAGLLCAAVSYRPGPEIFVIFESADSISVDGNYVESLDLSKEIERRREWRRLWLQDSLVVLMLPDSMSIDPDSLLDPSSSITLSGDQGFDDYTIASSALEELLNKHGLADLDDFSIGSISQHNSIRQNYAR